MDLLQGPSSQSKYHHPYFAPAEVEVLSEKQRGKLSATQEEKTRQQACAFVEAVGSRIGFPRKTIATAQNLYHRFHLFFPRKDFNYHDVTLAAIYVSTKMHDTLKKPRDILMVSYAVRFPEQAAKSKSVAGEIDVDPATLEHDRQRLLAVERLILETICFNFTSRMPFPYVIKIGRELGASKTLTKMAWRLAVDANRTLVPLQYPPHVVALASIYIAALLTSFEQASSQALPGSGLGNQMTKSAHEIATMLGQSGPWEDKFHVWTEDIDDIGHAILDLLIHIAQNPQTTTSPSTPQSPSPHLSSSIHSRAQAHAQAFPPPYKPDQLTRLKIAMREAEAQHRTPLSAARRARRSQRRVDLGEEHTVGDAASFGRNDGTVRFLFGPEGVVGGAV